MVSRSRLLSQKMERYRDRGICWQWPRKISPIAVKLAFRRGAAEGRSHPCNWYTSCVTQHTKEGFWKEQGRSVSALSSIPLLREGGWSLRKSNVAKSNVANAHLYQSRPVNSSWICSNISVQVWQKNTSQESNIFQEFGQLERNGGEQGDRFPFCHCCIPPWKGDGEGKPSPHVIGRSSKHSFSARIVSIATHSRTQRFLVVEFSRMTFIEFLERNGHKCS